MLLLIFEVFVAPCEADTGSSIVMRAGNTRRCSSVPLPPSIRSSDVSTPFLAIEGKSFQVSLSLLLGVELVLGSLK